MFGLDERIAALSGGDALLIVIAVAILLGLRHATDPDHLTAVSTLIATEEDRDARRAGALGLAWGLGHATTLFALGLPIVLASAHLPEGVQQGAEVAIGVVIMVLAVRLLRRWRGGRTEPLGRSPLQSFGIGLIHGIGGSAGVGVLLLAAIPDHGVGVLALVLFAAFTAVSMAVASVAFGYTLSRGLVLTRFARVAPVLGALSLTFGAWYALGAVEAVPYYF